MKGTENLDKNRDAEQGKDVLAELLRQVPSRIRAPAGDEQIIRQSVHSQWQELVRRRRARRIIWAGALAASLALTTTVALRLLPKSQPSGGLAVVATSEKLIGTAMTRSGGGSLSLLQHPATELSSGQTVLTGVESRLALRWHNGAMVRLDELTELELLSDTEMHLVAGRVYLDTALSDASMPPVTIQTPRGRIRHLGTQFMTRVSHGEMSVSVREGEIVYLPPTGGGGTGPSGGETIAGMGQHLEVSSDGSVQIAQIPTWGNRWEWVETVSPGFQSNGRSLSELLAWVGRETGRQIAYDTADAESLASATVLHGDLEVPPMQALAIATATSDLAAEVDMGLIRVSLSSPP